MKKIKKRILTVAAAALTVAMIFMASPQDRMVAYADVTDDDSPAIARYTILQKNPNTPDMQIVHFGGREWICIAYDGTGDKFVENDPCATLLLKDIDVYSIFNPNVDADNSTNAYSGSQLQSAIYMDIVDKFSEAEQHGAFPRKLEGGGENGDMKKMKGNELNSALLWPLSAWEAAGLCEEAVQVKDKNGECIPWWLRTPGDANSSAGAIANSHLHYSAMVNSGLGVRPAFDLDPFNTVFLSAAQKGKASGDPGKDALLQIGTNPNNEWKTTLLDDAHKDFSATPISPSVDGLLKINYSGAVKGKDEYISALIMDSSKNYTYYGRLAEASSAEGTVTVDLAGKYNDGDTLYLFNEHCNGDNATDYSSNLIEMGFSQYNELDQVELTVSQPPVGTEVETPSQPFPFGPGEDWLWDQQDPKPQVALADESKYTFTTADDHCVWISLDPFSDQRGGLNTTMVKGGSYLADIELAPDDSWYFGEHTKLVVNHAEVVQNDLAKTGHIRISVEPFSSQGDNTMTARGKTVKIKSKAKALKKTVKISPKKAYTIKNPIGSPTFKKVKANKSSGKFRVNAKTGQITVKKGLKRGTYKLTVRISAPGNDNYGPLTKNVVIKIKIYK